MSVMFSYCLIGNFPSAGSFLDRNFFYLSIKLNINYISKDERKAALILSKAVKLGEDMAKAGEKDTDKIVSEMIKLIETEPMAKIDYVQAVDAVSVKPVKEMTAPVLVAMAVYIGKTRLIDNFIYEG